MVNEPWYLGITLAAHETGGAIVLGVTRARMFYLTISLIIFLFPLAFSPGPGNMFFAANGARFGFAYTLPANTGYHVATLLVTLLIGVGFGWVSSLSPKVFVTMKYAGVIYVLYLAWKLANSGAPDEVTNVRQSNYWRRFGEGMVLLLLNPKAYLIILLIFSQFTSAAAQNDFKTLVWISLIFTLNNMIAFSLWAYGGDRLASRLRNKKNAIRLNRIFGFILALVALWMLIA